MRLNDFLLHVPHAGPAALSFHLNWWSDSQSLVAPFRKLVILPCSTARAPSSDWEGASVGLSICWTRMVHDLDEVALNDVPYLAALVKRGLSIVQRDVGWHSPRLEDYLSTLGRARFPLVAPLPKVVGRVRGASAVFTIERWSAPERHAMVLVRTEADGRIARAVLDERSAGGLYEVEFVVKRLRIVDGNCEIRDKTGLLLARIPADFADSLGPVTWPDGTW